MKHREHRETGIRDNGQKACHASASASSMDVASGLTLLL